MRGAYALVLATSCLTACNNEPSCDDERVESTVTAGVRLGPTRIDEIVVRAHNQEISCALADRSCQGADGRMELDVHGEFLVTLRTSEYATSMTIQVMLEHELVQTWSPMNLAVKRHDPSDPCVAYAGDTVAHVKVGDPTVYDQDTAPQ